MENSKKLTLKSPDFPEALHEVPMLPEHLNHVGAPVNGLLLRPSLTVVGNRLISVYGRKVTTRFAGELAEQGVVIVSGLAMGVDACAHRAALEAGGQCIAVLPSPLDNIVPVSNWRLAQEILDNGGALLSEYDSGAPPFKENFIARNRIMSGLSQATLITEAGEHSGARHTAKFAIEQNKTVMVVPGDIYSRGSQGINNLLRQGAMPVTDTSDILLALGLQPHKTKLRQVKGSNAYEQKVLDLLLTGMTDCEDLIEASEIPVSKFNQTLTMLEISGKIRPLGNNHWAIR